MSEVQATIETARNLRQIEGADNIVLAEVAGFPVVVRKDSVNEGDKVVYFPQDLQIPTYVGQQLGISNYLRRSQIVRTVKLRGQYSYGVALPVRDFKDMAVLPDGHVIDDWFGTKRYVHRLAAEGEPGFRAKQSREHPLLNRFTSIQRWNKFQEAIPAQTPVYITEKIHGTNVRIAVIDKVLMCGSHKNQWEIPDSPDEALRNWYWFPTLAYPQINEMLYKLGEQYQQVILFGETFGRGVQGKFNYGMGGLDFAAFDIMLNGVYQNPKYLFDVCEQFGVPTVPIDYIGAFDIMRAMMFAKSPSNFTKEHVREGVVIRPVSEDSQFKLGRVILKLINPDYDVKKSEGRIEDITFE